MRGENVINRDTGEEESGSPPRAWGEQVLEQRPGRLDRITPTCVGRTGEGSTQHGTRTDHPHVRRENDSNGYGPKPNIGSPPRAWGERLFPHRRQPVVRITPTCVGRTS